MRRTITVPGEPGPVFTYLADFTNAVEWDPGTVACRRIDDGEIAVGSTFELVAEFRGRKNTLMYEVTEFEAPHRFVIVGRSARFTSTDVLEVTAVGEGQVRIGYFAEFEMSGWLRLAEPFLRKSFEELADGAAAGIEKALS